MAFILQSPDFTNGDVLPQRQVYNGMGEHGKNLSPTLTWEGFPKETKSFAVTVFDPDAPTGSGWWHWVVVNIPSNVTSLPEGAGSKNGPLPQGAKQGKTDFGHAQYDGAAPPPGRMHRYIFKVYALNTPFIEMTEDTPPAQIGFALHHHMLGSASLTAIYGKK